MSSSPDSVSPTVCSKSFSKGSRPRLVSPPENLIASDPALPTYGKQRWFKKKKKEKKTNEKKGAFKLLFFLPEFYYHFILTSKTRPSNDKELIPPNKPCSYDFSYLAS